jgi:hypothetical protein
LNHAAVRRVSFGQRSGVSRDLPLLYQSVEKAILCRPSPFFNGLLFVECCDSNKNIRGNDAGDI